MANGSADSTEVVLVEFQTDTAQLESAQELLERTGQIDKKTADQLKKTNAELQKREQEIKDVAKATQQASEKSGASIEEVQAMMEGFINEFIAGWQEGVIDSLKEAGLEFDEFGKIVTKTTEPVEKLKQKLTDTKKLSPFDSINKQLSENKKRILDINTELSRLQKTGGGDSERAKKLRSELGALQTQTQKLQVEYDKINSSLDVFDNKEEEVKKSTSSLKGELRALTQQLAEMKLRGEDNTEQYKLLAQQAGEMKDAIGDAASEIRNFGSDTKNIDGLISAAQGVAGAFALAQGVEGLFGKESEELQETLLKVNSAMAILQGLQQIGNVLQKESAAGTFLQTAAQKIYNVVIGESIGLMAAFRIALASTGVGLLIIGIIALVAALQKTNKEVERANRLLERNKNIIDADTQAIQRNTDEQIARAEAINAKESEIIQLRGHSLALQRKAIGEANNLLIQQRDTLDETSEAYFKLNAEIENNNELIKDIDNKIIIERINLDKQLRTEQLQGIADNLQAQLDAAKKNTKKELDLAIDTARAKANIDLNEAGDNLPKRLAIEAALQKEIRGLNLAFARVLQEDKIAATETELLKAQRASQKINERTSQTEIDLQKKLIQQKAQLDLLQEGLTEKQKTHIREQSVSDQLELQKNFNKQSNENALQDFISANNALLEQVNISNEERLRLTEENIIAQAQIELEANKGLADKIKEINAKRDADIKAARLQNLQDTLNYELELEAARTGVLRRASERVVANERNTLKARISAINQLASLDIAAINRRQDALDESFNKALISQQEYNLQYAKLKDEEAKITEDTEIKKRELSKQTAQKIFDIAVQSASQLLSIVAEFGQQQTEAEIARIDEQRQRIDDLKEAGAITEKEATARLRRLETEERAIKRKQAERDKQIALFQAIVNTAAAVARALAEGGPILAVIVAALGAAQIAAIASKPLPKFGTGKKNSYEGFAEVGETGAELIERDGQMYIAPKRTIVWVGSKDKVFNPAETKQILEKTSMPHFALEKIDNNNITQMQAGIDYKKLGKAIGDNIPQLGLNVDGDGITSYIIYKNSFTTYLNNRRGFK